MQLQRSQRPLLRTRLLRIGLTAVLGLTVTAGALVALQAAAPTTVAQTGAGLDTIVTGEIWRASTLERLSRRSGSREGMLYHVSFGGATPAGCALAIEPAVLDRTVLTVDATHCGGWNEQQPL